MVTAPWTYELPATGSFAESLDDYEARTADGAHAGIVTGLVTHAGDLYLLVDAGRLPPLIHRRLAVRWTDVAEVDHDALVVTLAVDRARLDETALALDPANARHGPGADASRVHNLPGALAPSTAPGSEGPVDRGSALLTVAATVAATFSSFVIVTIWSAHGLTGWQYAAFVVPVLFAALAFALAGYRHYREPHAGRRPRARETAAG
jgi:hypothetical protein